ncbi:MAG: cobalt transporter [Chloroflexi bacterium RBG_16_58_14]|nr:MAG: cobalt transporter [Chloroflexi bacterium RBG_16_58_14]
MQNTSNHTPNYTNSYNLRLAFILNLGFTLFEIVGGIWTNSLAILADSVHDLGDSMSLGLSWYLERYSNKGGDERFSYGYRRFSLLGALINTVILIVGSLFILLRAVPRLIYPEQTNAQGMMFLAIIGILINGIAVLRLRKGKSLNVQIAAWHLFEDVLGWVAVLVVSIVLYFWDIPILDPLLSILITGYVLWNVIRNLKKTLALFLQAVPEDFNLEEVKRRLLSMEHVVSLHHTHLWSMDGEHHVLTTHLVVDPCTSRDEILVLKKEINSLTSDLDIAHTTLEVEYEDEDCRMKEENLFDEPL